MKKILFLVLLCFITGNINAQKIISFSALQYTESGIGTSLNYEKILDKDGYVSFYCPLTFTQRTRTEYSGAYHFYLMPGLKLYPTGQGKSKWAIGPNLVLSKGKDYKDIYPFESIKDHTQVGVLVNNSLNMVVNEHVYLGLEMGYGFTYYNMLGNEKQGIGGLTQGNFKLGWRYTKK